MQLRALCRHRTSRRKPTNRRSIGCEAGFGFDSHCDEVSTEITVGQRWGIFSRKVQRWAVATVVSVENGTVNLKYRDYPGFCHVPAVEMLMLNDDLQFLEPLEEINPRPVLPAPR